MTEAQAAKVEVFTLHEKDKIVNDFEYYNQKKEDGGDLRFFACVSNELAKFTF